MHVDFYMKLVYVTKMKNGRKFDLLTELFTAMYVLVEQLNAIYARVEHADQLLCKVRIKLEWKYHKESGIKRLETIMQEIRGIIRVELEEELEAGVMSISSSRRNSHVRSEGSSLDSFFSKLESIPEYVSEDDIHVDHRFIHTGITEIEIAKSKLELWSIVHEMERCGFIRRTSQDNEIDYSNTSIDPELHLNPVVPIRRRQRFSFKSKTLSILKMFKVWTHTRYELLQCTNSHRKVA
jgi:hypothetical protein